MRDYPLIFTTENVLGIMAGRKTMTRRIITDRNSICIYKLSSLDFNSARAYGRCIKVSHRFDDTIQRVVCRYWSDGVHNDKFYVRETYAQCDWGDLKGTEKDAADYTYKAGCSREWLKKIKWKPSILMPKKAARLYLEIIDIKAERLQDITVRDAIAEGIEPEPTGDFLFRNYLYNSKKAFSNYLYISPLESFKSMWIAIHDYLSWEKNPWVWAITFRIEQRETPSQDRIIRKFERMFPLAKYHDYD